MIWIALSWFAAFLVLAIATGYLHAVLETRRLRATIDTTDAQRAVLSALVRRLGQHGLTPR
ncbi:MAG TPA: hypothetical protein VNE16_04160 [Vicinamibacterales bacterium]|nr:hypothetical protein [Vicinamibacterales bacterium]